MSSAATILDRLSQGLELESDSDIARLFDVGRSTVSGWRTRDSIPIKQFIALAVARDLSMNWLLLGEGPMHRAATPDTPPMTRAPTSIKAIMAAEAREAERELGLEEVATLARLGREEATWQVMNALLRAHPRGLFLEELEAALGLDIRELSANITLLQRMGSVEEDSEGRYKFLSAPRFKTLRGSSLPDQHQCALHGAATLLHTVLPAIERKEGRLTLLEGRIRAGRGTRLLKELSDLVMGAANEAIAEPGEEEAFTVVLGVAVKGSGG